MHHLHHINIMQMLHYCTSCCWWTQFKIFSNKELNHSDDDVHWVFIREVMWWRWGTRLFVRVKFRSSEMTWKWEGNLVDPWNIWSPFDKILQQIVWIVDNNVWDPIRTQSNFDRIIFSSQNFPEVSQFSAADANCFPERSPMLDTGHFHTRNFHWKDWTNCLSDEYGNVAKMMMVVKLMLVI